MTTIFIISTIIESLIAFFIIWGYWNEEKVIEFEDRIIAKFKGNIQKQTSAKITAFNSYNSSRQNKNCI